MLEPEVLKRLKDNSDFELFTEDVLVAIADLDTVSDLKNMSDEKAGQEAKVRALAAERLQEIFKPIITFKQKENKDIEFLRKQKKKYAL